MVTFFFNSDNGAEASGTSAANTKLHLKLDKQSKINFNIPFVYTLTTANHLPKQRFKNTWVLCV